MDVHACACPRRSTDEVAAATGEGAQQDRITGVCPLLFNANQRRSPPQDDVQNIFMLYAYWARADFIFGRPARGENGPDVGE
jgi:hypothetical protein